MTTNGLQVWQKISEKIKEKGISQRELSRRSEIYQGNLTALKKGRIKKPSFELICKIADGLEVEVDDLRFDK